MQKTRLKSDQLNLLGESSISHRFPHGCLTKNRARESLYIRLIHAIPNAPFAAILGRFFPLRLIKSHVPAMPIPTSNIES